jgi:hypothetical protein
MIDSQYFSSTERSFNLCAISPSFFSVVSPFLRAVLAAPIATLKPIFSPNFKAAAPGPA